MEQNVRLGRVAGIPEGANWSVAVILVIIAVILAVSALPAAVPHRPTALYWLVALVAVALYLVCLLARELTPRSRWPRSWRRTPTWRRPWSTVGDFIDQVSAWSRQGAFPVVEPGGRPAWPVLADQLARVSVAAGHELRVGQTALRVAQLPGGSRRPGRAAADALPARQPGRAVVLADGQVVGLVTMADLRQALRCRGLTSTASG